MSLHVFASIVTPFGTAANNRGENEGNITPLQKLIWFGQAHTTVSAEAIRFALRRLLAEEEPQGTNRRWNESARVNEWRDPAFIAWAFDEKGGYANPEALHYIDDDLLGFMSAEAAKEEAEAGEPVEPAPEPSAAKGRKPKTPKKPKAKGTATVRRAVLEVTRAVSLTPWPGDVTFNAASPRATPSAAKKGDNPVPYGTEVHATRYQFGLALTPERLRDPSRAARALHALAKLHTVAGNHGRFLYQFAPEGIVFRVTDDPAPRLLYCFETADEGQTVDAPVLARRVEDGDIRADELVFGGSIAHTATAQKLREKGARIPEPPGVQAAVAEVVRRIDSRAAQRR
jgi:CRISPR-associated protein Cst2